jgi:hypothetical protein
MLMNGHRMLASRAIRLVRERTMLSIADRMLVIARVELAIGAIQLWREDRMLVSARARSGRARDQYAIERVIDVRRSVMSMTCVLMTIRSSEMALQRSPTA